MRHSTLSKLGFLFVMATVFALAPQVCAQCQGGLCSSSNVYSAVYYSCGGGCGGEVAVAVIYPEYGEADYWYPSTVTGYCCGTAVCTDWVPPQDGCPIQTRPTSASREERTLWRGESIFLVRQCDGGYAAVDLGAAS